MAAGLERGQRAALLANEGRLSLRKLRRFEGAPMASTKWEAPSG